MDLKRLFELQRTFNERVGLDDEYFARHFSANQPYKHALIEGGQWIDNMLKAMSSEIEELRNCTYWKHWCSEAQEGQRYKIKDLQAARKEVIDMLHFWISLCQILGMSADMVGDMYETKLAKNIKRQDDGYSIEKKDLAWELFMQHPDRNSKLGSLVGESLEDLSQDAQVYYISWAKYLLDPIHSRAESCTFPSLQCNGCRLCGKQICDARGQVETKTVLEVEPESLCNTCVNEENDCSMAVGVTHSCIRYKRKSNIPIVPNCSKCGRKCTAGHAMTGEGPICGSCV